MIKSSKKIALLYFCISFIWIYTSDTFFEIILSNLSKNQLSFFNTLKGVVFVTITAVLLYKLINRYYKTIKRSEEEYRAMFDQNPNPMWIYDIETLGFLKVNQAAISKYGFSETEFLKMKALDIRPKEEVEKFTNYILNNDHVVGNAGVWTHLLKDKSTIKIEAYVYDILYNNIKAKLVLLLDVTEKIKNEEQLMLQQQILEETNIKLEATVKELKLSKEKIAGTQKIAKIGGWRYTLEEDCFDFTLGFYEIMNSSPSDDRINRLSDLKKFICEDDIEKLNNFLFHFKNGDGEGECTLRVRYGDKWRFIKLGALLTSYGPQHNVLEGFIQDITRLELKDQLIKTTLERFEQLATAINDTIYEWDYRGNSIRWSGNVESLVGYTDTEIFYREEWWLERIHPDDFQKSYNLLKDAITKGEETLKREYRFRAENGQYKLLYDQATIKYDEHKNVIKIIGSLHDIEEITKINRENKRLGKIVNKVKNLIIILNKEGYIEWVNGAFLDKTEYQWKEVIGKRPWELFRSTPSSEATIEFMIEAMKKNKYFNVEIENIMKDDSICWFQIDGSPIYDDKNNYEGYIAIESDITERKVKEEKIKLQNKLLKESAWINSHQVRKPLASILGLIQLMQLADNEKETEEYLSLLEICSNELDVIIRRSVDLTEIKE